MKMTFTAIPLVAASLTFLSTGCVSNSGGHASYPYGYPSRISPRSADASEDYLVTPLAQPRFHSGGVSSANPYDPDSTSNPYGRYGSKYSPDSINNPYGAGNPYSTKPIYVVPSK